MSINFLSETYAKRLGFPSSSDIGLEDFIRSLELVVKGKGFFLLKIDGERDEKIYTFVVNVPASDFVLRKDTDNIREGVVFILSELEKSEIYP